MSALKLSLLFMRIVQLFLIVSGINYCYDFIKLLSSGEESYLIWSWRLNGDLGSSHSFNLGQRQTLFSFVLNWLQMFALLIIYLLISQVIIQILRSLKSFKAFVEENIARFKRIASLSLAAFFLNLLQVRVITDNKDLNLSWDFELSYLIFMFAALILSEIFKEGKQMADEQNSIV